MDDMLDGYDEAIEIADGKLEDEIANGAEATTALMNLALPLSHQFDMDQQAVADDITKAFTYRIGNDPEGYQDDLASPAP